MRARAQKLRGSQATKQKQKKALTFVRIAILCNARRDESERSDAFGRRKRDVRNCRIEASIKRR